jgi:hypothetical protein
MATINGMPPGSLFESNAGQAVELEMDVQLTVRDEVDYLDVIFNGKPLYQARLEEHARRGQFPRLAIEQSGWLLVRVVTSHADSYRLATTSPFYFRFGGQDRVSRGAVAYFHERLEEYATSVAAKPATSNSTQKAIDDARTFWRARWQGANVP